MTERGVLIFFEVKPFSDFLGEVFIGEGAGGKGIVGKNGLSVAGGFPEADGAGDDRFKDLFGKVFLDLMEDLAAEVGADIKHGHEDAADGELGIDAGVAQLVDNLKDLVEAFEGEVFTLEGDDQKIGGGEGVHGNDPEGRRTIEDNGLVIAFTAEWFEELAELNEVIFALAEFNFEGGQVHLGGEQIEVFCIGGKDTFGETFLAVEQRVNAAARLLVETEPGGGIGLRVEINEQCGNLSIGQPGGEVDGGGGFADPALLVGNSKDFGRHREELSWENGSSKRKSVVMLDQQEFVLRRTAWGTADYERMRGWREEILRRPLGRRLTEADTAGEAEQDHFGLWRGGEELAAGITGKEEAGPVESRRLRQMWVVPLWRGRGLGGSLLREVEALYAARGVVRLVLHARLTAVGFYERAGYKRCGEVFEEVGIGHIRMEKSLGGVDAPVDY